MSRPECPELDDAQMRDLENFFTGKSEQWLTVASQQLIDDSEVDPGPYRNGGTPANVTKAFVIVGRVLSEKK